MPSRGAEKGLDNRLFDILCSLVYSSCTLQPPPLSERTAQLEIVYNDKLADLNLLDVETLRLPSLPLAVRQTLQEAVNLMDRKTDFQKFKEVSTELMIADFLSELLRRGGITSQMSYNNNEGNSAPPVKSLNTCESSTSSLNNENPNITLQDLSTAEVNPVMLGLCLVDEIYSIRFTSIKTYLPHLLSYVMKVIVYYHGTYSEYALTVLKHLVEYVHTIYVAGEAKRKAHSKLVQQPKQTNTLTVFGGTDVLSSVFYDSENASVNPVFAVNEAIGKEMRALIGSVQQELDNVERATSAAPVMVIGLLRIASVVLRHSEIITRTLQGTLSDLYNLSQCFVYHPNRYMRMISSKCLSLIISSYVNSRGAAVVSSEVCAKALDSLRSDKRIIRCAAVCTLRVLLDIVPSVKDYKLEESCEIILELYNGLKTSAERAEFKSFFSRLAILESSYDQKRCLYDNVVLESLADYQKLIKEDIVSEMLNLRTYICRVNWAVFGDVRKAAIENNLIKFIKEYTRIKPEDDKEQKQNELLAAWFAASALLASYHESNLSSHFENKILDLLKPSINAMRFSDALLMIYYEIGLLKMHVSEKFTSALDARAEEVLLKAKESIQEFRKANTAEIEDYIENCREGKLLGQGAESRRDPPFLYPSRGDTIAFLGYATADGLSARCSNDAESDEKHRIMEVRISEIVWAANILFLKPTSPFPKDSSAVKRAQQFWLKVKELLIPLLAHPCTPVRQNGGCVLGRLVKKTIQAMFLDTATESQISGPVRSKKVNVSGPDGDLNISTRNQFYGFAELYSRSELITLITDFIRAISMETDCHAQCVMLYALSGGTLGGTLDVAKRREQQRIQSELVSDATMGRLVGMLQECERVREAALEVLLCVGNTARQSQRVQDLLANCLMMHAKSLDNIFQAQQVARSCATLSLILKSCPALLTHKMVSLLMRSICNNLRARYRGVNTYARALHSSIPSAPCAVYSPRIMPIGKSSSETPKHGSLNFHSVSTSPTRPRTTEPDYPTGSSHDLTEGGRQGWRTRSESFEQTSSLLLEEMAQVCVHLELLNRIFSTAKNTMSVKPPLTDDATGGRRRDRKELNMKNASAGVLSVILESGQTQVILDTLWCCLSETSAAINSMTTLQSGPSVMEASQTVGSGDHTSPWLHGRGHSENNLCTPKSPPEKCFTGQGLFFSTQGLLSKDKYTYEMTQTTTIMTNAVKIQHRALCALTDVLTLSPSNITGFAHKTAFVDFLRQEYLRLCRLNHQKGETSKGKEENAMVTLIGQTSNEQNRLSIIRLFGLLGGIDPNGEGMANLGIIVGDESAAASVPPVPSTSVKKNRQRPDHNAILMMVHTRTLIAMNTPDPRKDMYPFAGGDNYSVIAVYRLLVKMFKPSTSTSDQALIGALRVSVSLMKEIPAEQIQGWDLMEAIISLIRGGKENVGSDVLIIALDVLPNLIRRRTKIASRLVEEFFAMVLHCWDPSNKRLFLTLLGLVEELHKVNLEDSEKFSSKSYADLIAPNVSQCDDASQSDRKNEFNEDIYSGSSLYLKLVDVAVKDRTPTRSITAKVIAILSLIEHQSQIVPLIIVNFIDGCLNVPQIQVGLRLAGARMVAKLIVRFSCDVSIGPLIAVLYQIICDEACTAEPGTVSQVMEILSSIQAYILPDSIVKSVINNIERIAIKLEKEHASIFPHFSDQSLFTQIPSLPQTYESSNLLSPSGHMTKYTVISSIENAIKEGQRSGKNFDWNSWFFDLQRQILITSPQVAYRISIEIFDRHEPARKTLFYSAFYCYFLDVFKPSESSLFKTGTSDSVRKKVQRVFYMLLKYGNSESVDTCLGLNDFLQRFCPPRECPSILAGNNSASLKNRIGKDDYFGEGSLLDEDMFMINRGGTAPVIGVDVWQSRNNERGRPASMGVSTHGSESSISTTQLLNKSPLEKDQKEIQNGITRVGNTRKDLLAKPHLETNNGDTRLPRAHNATDLSLSASTWSLFSLADLTKVALKHRLHDKAARYLECQLALELKPEQMKDRNKPGSSIMVNISLADKSDIASSIVNCLAQEYKYNDMQYSVTGLFNSVKVSVDANAYELLQWWSGALSAYRDKIRVFDSSVQEYMSKHGISQVGGNSVPYCVVQSYSEKEVFCISPCMPVRQNQVTSESSSITSESSSTNEIRNSDQGNSGPSISIKDVCGYLRTLVFCGMWEEGYRFAKDHFEIINQASIASKDSTGKTPQGFGTRILPQSDQGGDLSSVYAGLCAVIMQKWDSVKKFAEVMKDQTSRLLFQQLALAHRESEFEANQYNKAQVNVPGGNQSDRQQILTGYSDSQTLESINTALEKNFHRALLVIDEDLKRKLPLSYAHAYDVISKLQHFQEIEEARLYRRRDTPNYLRKTIRTMWFQRFKAMKPDSLTMLMSLIIYSLAATPREITDVLYHFSKVVRGTHSQLGTWAMSSLQADSLQHTRPGSLLSADLTSNICSPTLSCSSYGYNLSNEASLSTSFAEGQASAAIGTSKDSLYANLQNKDVLIDYCEYLWSAGDRNMAIKGINAFLDTPNASAVASMSSKEAMVKPKSIDDIGYAHVLLGQWKQELLPDRFWKQKYRDEILKHHHKAIQTLPKEYITWHNWGLINYRIQQYDSKLSVADREMYVERAHSGFVAAICHGEKQKVTIQDAMRLLQLWIIHKGIDIIGESVVDAVHRIPAALWCVCVPQVAVHLGNKNDNVWIVIRTILEKACFAYPQHSIYSLLLAILSDPDGVGVRLRPSRAQVILNGSCETELYEQARDVAESLISLALSPVERIRDNIGYALKYLQGINGISTVAQRDSILMYVGQGLNIATKHKEELSELGDVIGVIKVLQKHVETITSSVGQIKQSADYCSQLYNELQEHVKEMRALELKTSGNKLSGMKELKLWIPGNYAPETLNAPTIFAFMEHVEVIDSKRRPRKLNIVGSDGSINAYCLKGNEDLRVDAQAMQLFGLFNSLIDNSANAISRFSVIPLSESVGLLGWVENSETLYVIIRTFRQRGGLPQQSEVSMLAKDCNINGRTFSRLQSLQKTEQLSNMFSKVPSNDLNLVFWYCSFNAEIWLKRRTKYTSSLANMSTAGYILGLGDRHLGNLLIQMNTGAVVHIDFGDCFDVARYRIIYPETIPFRLTPMLVNAMEVFGVSGVFQCSCEASMSTMRTNRDSFVALLSTFLYDPVIDKRILQQNRGSVQNVIDAVRMKLRGLEMPYYMYSQDKRGFPWAIPSLYFKPKPREESMNEIVQERSVSLASSEVNSDGEDNESKGLFPALGMQEKQPASVEWESNANGANEEVQHIAAELPPAESEIVPENRLPMRPDLQMVLAQAAISRQMRSSGVHKEDMSVKDQVRILIGEATKVENLASVFAGWNPWW